MKHAFFSRIGAALCALSAAAVLFAGCTPKEDPIDNTNKDVAVLKVELDFTKVELIVGGYQPLTATVSPSNATNKTVSWSSSNTSVATVDGSGKVTGIAAGSATITATAGGKSATCAVTVQEPTDPYHIFLTSELTLEVGDTYK